MPNPPNAVLHSAEQGYTPAAADRYFRGRPDYPPEVNARLRGQAILTVPYGTAEFHFIKQP